MVIRTNTLKNDKDKKIIENCCCYCKILKIVAVFKTFTIFVVNVF